MLIFNVHEIHASPQQYLFSFFQENDTSFQQEDTIKHLENLVFSFQMWHSFLARRPAFVRRIFHLVFYFYSEGFIETYNDGSFTPMGPTNVCQYLGYCRVLQLIRVYCKLNSDQLFKLRSIEYPYDDVSFTPMGSSNIILCLGYCRIPQLIKLYWDMKSDQVFGFSIIEYPCNDISFTSLGASSFFRCFGYCRLLQLIGGYSNIESDSRFELSGITNPNIDVSCTPNDLNGTICTIWGLWVTVAGQDFEYRTFDVPQS